MKSTRVKDGARSASCASAPSMLRPWATWPSVCSRTKPNLCIFCLRHLGQSVENTQDHTQENQISIVLELDVNVRHRDLRYDRGHAESSDSPDEWIASRADDAEALEYCEADQTPEGHVAE